MGIKSKAHKIISYEPNIIGKAYIILKNCRMKKNVLQMQRAGFVSLFFILVLVSCKKKTQPIIEEKTSSTCLDKKEIVALSLVEVKNSKAFQNLRLTGKVDYNPNTVVNYLSLVSGSVISSSISLGDKVQKDQVLAVIRSEELTNMQSEARQLQGKLEVVQRNLASVQSFYDDHIASEKELIEAQSEKKSVEAKLEKLRSNLQLYHPGKEKNTFQIRASRSGYIVSNQLTEGGQIRAEGDPLFTISDMNEVWVNMNVYAANLDIVKAGDSIDIKAKSYPNKVFKGVIQQVSHVIDPEDNVAKARVVLKNEALQLKPGLFIEGNLKIKKESEMPILSAEAIVYHNDKYYVVVFKDNCRLENREVEIAFQDEKNMYVKSGIAPEEQVVTRNALLHFEDNRR